MTRLRSFGTSPRQARSARHVAMPVDAHGSYASCEVKPLFDPVVTWAIYAAALGALLAITGFCAATWLLDLFAGAPAA